MSSHRFFSMRWLVYSIFSSCCMMLMSWMFVEYFSISCGVCAQLCIGIYWYVRYLRIWISVFSAYFWSTGSIALNVYICWFTFIFCAIFLFLYHKKIMIHNPHMRVAIQDVICMELIHQMGSITKNNPSIRRIIGRIGWKANRLYLELELAQISYKAQCW